MKFLVTGGAGFIGANYCLGMTDAYPDDMFICLDALTYAGNLETLQPLSGKSNFRFVRGNICDGQLVFDLFAREKFDYVINFAAESHVDRSIENPRIFLETNVLGVQTLLDACREYGIRRFHQVSTDEVYGDLPLGSGRPFTEKSSLRASSPYSASKAGADLLVLAYRRTYGLSVTISRSSNNYGPYQFPEKLIPFVISRALADEPIPIYGSGVNVRDWLYVSDHCAAIDLIVRKGKDGEIYNVGGNCQKSNLEVVKRILHEIGKPESLITFVKDRAGHDLRYALDASKLIKELGWRPKYVFEEGIVSTIEWNIAHRDWLGRAISGEYRRFNETCGG